MKLITFVSAGAFIFLSAFVMKESAYRAGREHNRQAAGLYDTKWRLKKIHVEGKEETLTGNAFIRFNQVKKSAGGNGGCNTFGSTVAVSGNTISFKDIFSTKMYCEGIQETEDAFFKQLEKVNRFEIKDKSLVLYHDRDILLEFASE